MTIIRVKAKTFLSVRTVVLSLTNRFRLFLSDSFRYYWILFRQLSFTKRDILCSSPGPTNRLIAGQLRGFVQWPIILSVTYFWWIPKTTVKYTIRLQPTMFVTCKTLTVFRPKNRSSVQLMRRGMSVSARTMESTMWYTYIHIYGTIENETRALNQI